MTDQDDVQALIKRLKALGDTRTEVEDLSLAALERLQAEVMHWKREADGYQRLVAAAAEKPDARMLVLLDLGKGELRVFGPNPAREQEIAHGVGKLISAAMGAAFQQAKESEHAKRADAAEARVTRLRKALAECLWAAGGGCSDDVSDDLLCEVPEQVRAFQVSEERLKRERDAAEAEAKRLREALDTAHVDLDRITHMCAYEPDAQKTYDHAFDSWVRAGNALAATQPPSEQRAEGWIACSERMPQDCVIVLCAWPNGRVAAGDYLSTALNYVREKGWFIPYPKPPGAPTHWRPLPAPPQPQQPAKAEGEA